MALAVAGCSIGPSEARADGAVTVRLGYLATLVQAPALVGIEQGTFATHLGDHRLAPQAFAAGPDAVTALLSGALDIAYLGPNPAINAYQRSDGDAVRIVSGATSGGTSLVVRAGIVDAEGLRGRSVATPQLGGTQDVALRSWLRSNGLATDTAGGGDVSIAPRSNADTFNGLRSGAIDAAWVPEPWATRLIREAGGRRLVDERSLWPDGQFATAQVVVRTEFLEQHPDVVAAVLAGHLDAIDRLAADPVAARHAVNDGIEAATGKRLADDLLAEAWPMVSFGADPLPTTLRAATTRAHDLGFLPSADIDGIYDLALLNDELARRGQPGVSP
jgi:NitT/TauT family transport system substrate-binding protein